MSHVSHERTHILDDDVRSLLENGEIGIVQAELPAGTIARVNPAFCRILHVAAADIVGKPLTALALSGNGQELLEQRLSALATSATGRFDEDLELGAQMDEARRWANFDAYAMRNGQVPRVLIVVRDVTARKRSEGENELLRRRYAEQLELSQRDRDAFDQSLEEAVRRRHEFLAVLSHELRNPLAPIQNATRVARTPTATPDELQWSLAVIERQVQNMARLLDDLMDVSRIVRGRLELQVVRTSLNDAISAAIETTRPLIESKDHVLQVHLPDETMWVEGDPVRLSQIFGNLLNNAANYTERGGELTIRASRKQDAWIVHVCDSGFGIAPELLPHVFEMFVQSRKSGRTTGGLGIGLALVDGLVKLHHGSITAHSEGAGRGSEFTVRLPAPVSTHVTWKGEMQQADAGRTSVLRILVADDNVDAAESLAILLRLQGHEVRVAHDGLGAVREAEAFRPEVALVDIGMPIMNGHDVARWIRAQPWGGNILVIAQTGWNQPMDRVQTSLSGFDKHLAKPVSIGDLTACFSTRKNSQVET